jgi:dTDP-4-dehydrorhamnose 3,5-epimerase-like enzyme
MLVLCHDFAECEPNSTVAQTNTSFNHTRGTLRGLHRRMPPYAEAKLVRRTRGAIVDDEVRPKSQTVCRTRLPDAGNKTEVICQVSGRCKPAGVIYKIAGTNPVWVVGAEPRR